MSTFKRAQEFNAGDLVWIPLGVGQSVEGKVLGRFLEGIAIMPGGELTAVHVDPAQVLEAASPR